MPRYYCDYCDTYLTHDSPSVRKQHNAGYKHKANVRTYYQQYEAQLNQSLIDQKVKEHLGAFRPPVAQYNQMRPGMPILPMPLPIPGQLHPGFRPPVLPRPMPGIPGYISGPHMNQMVPPPGAPLPSQTNGLQRPLIASLPPPPPPPMVPGSAGIPTSGGPPVFAPPVYQPNVSVPSPPTTGGGDGSNINNAQAPEAN
ncbi:u1 small nuclear ribonucleoprotein c [Phtheirospermum japonicum]|uniref:U1 small nuclear ribonucleoprotein C n=1 Tax=Phtheirospermum japonicum TaxID=374723 RepID=A0A830D492_9LAMI|nr:u1 small nuclear ribonucleoprotein c [Phtheirospermum japonicum]